MGEDVVRKSFEGVCECRLYDFGRPLNGDGCSLAGEVIGEVGSAYGIVI